MALPEFDGRYDQWLQFRDMYEQMIHGNDSFSKVEKLYYLKGSLKGEALKVIEAFPICAASYNAAWSAMQLGETPSAWGIMLTQLLTSKLDDGTQRDWERTVEAQENASYSDLIIFLRTQARILEALVEDRVDQRNQTVSKNPRLAEHVTTGERKANCFIFGADHVMAKCDEFVSAPVKKRIRIARTKELCLNCLCKGHYRNKCASKVRYRVCKGAHHSLLHMWLTKENAIPDTPSKSISNVNERFIIFFFIEYQSGKCYFNYGYYQSERLLWRALYSVSERKGMVIEARALLDSGSQLNVMTEKRCKRLGLQRHTSGITLTGIGKCEVNSATAVTAEIASKTSKYARIMDFLVKDGITHNLQPLQLPNVCIPCDGEIADPAWDQALNGGRLGVHKVYDYHLYFINTVFGWVITGPKQRPHKPSVICSHVSIAEQMERFWSIEEIRQENSLTRDERDCERHFIETHSRDETGHYTVKLPMKINGWEMIGESLATAKKRFVQLENRLMKDKALRDSYCFAIQQYIASGFLVKVSPNVSLANNSSEMKPCYLPHHPVVKQSSTSTKVRPVFDGSAKTSTGLALNEVLLNGPDLQDSLFDLVLRFRSYPIALIADIEKMYLQVKVHPEHTSLQRILWRNSEEEHINHYELQRVIFGLTPSSFLATRILFQLAVDEGDRLGNGQAGFARMLLRR
uniref:DUF1758 domain-containing protein n=1 Tax=Anopheles epiroticus TaxID=199890 RepID=A0A182PUN4_9DIPT